MGVNDSIRAYNGVVTWINNNNIDIGEPKKKSFRQIELHMNSVFIRFCKENNLEFCKNNSKSYRGTFSPAMSNCRVIQENWNLWTKWAKQNYGKSI
jgi:hypothetical protein